MKSTKFLTRNLFVQRLWAAKNVQGRQLKHEDIKNANFPKQVSPERVKLLRVEENSAKTKKKH